MNKKKKNKTPTRTKFYFTASGRWCIGFYCIYICNSCAMYNINVTNIIYIKERLFRCVTKSTYIHFYT